MKNNLFKRSLVYGIVLLFIGLSVTPSMGGYTEKISNQSTEEAHTNFPLDGGLLAYWKFDNCSGGIAYDSSGHRYHGTIYGATCDGGFIVFDGVDDYVDFDNHSENLGFNKTDDYKISIIGVKSTSTDTGVIYGMSHSIGNRKYVELELNSDGNFVFRVGTEECVINVSSTGTYNDGLWHNVECVYYGSATDPTLKIYVDGELEDNITKWQCPFSNEDFYTAKMGRKSHDSVDYFDGVIDDVKIYKSTTGNRAPGKPS
ncbi:MAG: LamG domain-containing protein, partial [Thermoplasmatales archaeon]